MIPINNKLNVKKNESGPSNFLLELSHLMNNSEFRTFFDKYFNDWDEIKAVLMFMKTYQFIDHEYKKYFNISPTPEKMSIILKDMMNNNECRNVLVKSMDNFINNDNNNNDLKILNLYFTKSIKDDIII